MEYKSTRVCIIVALNVFTSLYVCFRWKTNIKSHNGSKVTMGEKNRDILSTIILAKNKS